MRHGSDSGGVMKKEVARTEFIGGKGMPFDFIVSRSSVPPSRIDHNHKGYYAQIDDEYIPINFKDEIVQYDDGTFIIDKKGSPPSEPSQILKDGLPEGMSEEILSDIKDCPSVGACFLWALPSFADDPYLCAKVDIFPIIKDDETVVEVSDLILISLTAIQLKFSIHFTVDIKWPKRISD